MAEFTPEPEVGSAPLIARAGHVAQLATAAVSLSLVIGAGVWGYQLMARDASGIPVVRALEGPMRERPAEAGGEVALHTGLAVNAVAAEGSAAPTEERLVLAPQGQGLTEDDLIARPVSLAEGEEGGAVDDPALAGLVDPEAAVPAENAAVAQPVVQAVAEGPAEAPPEAGETVAAVAAELTADQIQALADSITAGVAPLSDLAPAGVDPIPASVPGVSRALRPPARPAAHSPGTTTEAALDPLAGLSDVQPAVATTSRGPTLRAQEIPVGTALVQLGAFPTQDRAAEAWGRISAAFSDYIVGREPIVQEASSAGQTFYRLRALGFDDLGDARRFCSALVAEGADCIPVMAR